MKNPLKVLCIFDGDDPRPRGYDFAEEFSSEIWQSESEIVAGLRELGHEVRMLVLVHDIEILVEEIRENRPDVVFNLLEEFQRDAAKVPHVVCVLELMGIPYTGSTPMALRLCKDKALAKTVLAQAGVSTPAFQVVEYGKPPQRAQGLGFPIIIKPAIEDASYGISEASVVSTDKAFVKRARFLLDKTRQDVIAERYIEGRELYASLIGVEKIKVFPLRGVRFNKREKALNSGRSGKLKNPGPAIASYRVKWDTDYRWKWDVEYNFAENLEESVLRGVEETCKAAYRALGITGYSRIDLRLDKDNTPMILEVNPNPNLSTTEDFAHSAKKAGIGWENVLQMILDQAFLARPRQGLIH